MAKKAKAAIEKVRKALHDAVSDMEGDEYREVLKTLHGDVEGRIEALEDEEAALDEEEEDEDEDDEFDDDLDEDDDDLDGLDDNDDEDA
jgi:DNA-directed RNA polymerase delta subunit